MHPLSLLILLFVTVAIRCEELQFKVIYESQLCTWTLGEEPNCTYSPTGGEPRSIAYDASRDTLYWTVYTDEGRKVYRTNGAGGEEVVHKFPSQMVHLWIDSHTDYLYLSSSTGRGSVWRLHLSGNGPVEEICKSFYDVSAIAVVDSYLYGYNRDLWGNLTIYKAPVASCTSSSSVFVATVDPTAFVTSEITMAVDLQLRRIYFAPGNVFQIWYADMDGTSQVATPFWDDRASALVVIDTRVYATLSSFPPSDSEAVIFSSNGTVLDSQIIQVLYYDYSYL